MGKFTELNPCSWFLMVQPFCVFWARYLLFNSRGGPLGKQVFDWLISILHLSQVLTTVVFHSVCQFHSSVTDQKIFFSLVWALLVKRVMTFRGKKLRPLQGPQSWKTILLSTWCMKMYQSISYRRKTVMSFIFHSV